MEKAPWRVCRHDDLPSSPSMASRNEACKAEGVSTFSVGVWSGDMVSTYSVYYVQTYMQTGFTLLSCVGNRIESFDMSNIELSVPGTTLLRSHIRKLLHLYWTHTILVLGCLRFTKLCWVGKHVNIIMKPTNSPTQGQLNPRRNRLKVAFGPLLATVNNFSWVGIGFR